MDFKKYLTVACAIVAMTGTALFAGSSNIQIKAPTVTSSYTAANGDLNTQIGIEVGKIQTRLNTDYFSKLHDQTELARGFANANATAAANNVPFTGFQNYDLFCVMLGTNLAVSLPSTSASSINDDFSNIKDKGDVYIGAGTGGFAGQVGVNCSFLLKNLYLSAKFGMSNASQKFGSGSTATDVAFDQKMFGIGANYTLLESWDFAWGLLKWRGVSVGTGLVYNYNTIAVTLPIDDQDQSYTGSYYDSSTLTTYNYSGTAKVTGIKAKLSIDSSSLVVPCEIMTSVQALWLFNLGLGAGIDLAIPTSTIKLDGSASVTANGSITGITGGVTSAPQTISTVPNGAGYAKVTGTNTTSSPEFFDVISPKVFGDLGFNISIVKIDIPVSYYPITKAFSIGAQAGVVW